MTWNRPPGTFRKTAGWLDWFAGREQTRVQLPAVRGCDDTATSSAPAAELRAGASKLHALRRVRQGAIARAARPPGLTHRLQWFVQATCHGADSRAMVDACLSCRRPWRAAWRQFGVAQHRGRRAQAAAARRRRAAVRWNFVKRLVDFTPRTS